MRLTRLLAIVSASAALLSCGTPRPIPAGGNDYVSNGYQDIDTKKSTESISRVKVSDETASYKDIFEYMRGRVPGVQIGYASPGSTPSITIRGESSINSSTQPLFVVDGSVVSDISLINPNDVDSIDVMKDSSTSIYGSRGANGVIVIKTKTARAAAEAESAARKAQKAAVKAEKAAKSDSKAAKSKKK